MNYVVVENESKVSLLDSLNSKNVTEIETELMEVLANQNELEIELGTLKDIDMSGIFMLYILKQKSKLNGKNIQFSIKNEYLKRIIFKTPIGFLLT